MGEGPDELLYVVTDEDARELLRLEPDDEPGEEEPEPHATLLGNTWLTQPHAGSAHTLPAASLNRGAVTIDSLWRDARPRPRPDDVAALREI